MFSTENNLKFPNSVLETNSLTRQKTLQNFSAKLWGLLYCIPQIRARGEKAKS